ncbi:MAG: hypothetical protein C0478_14685, partial [Planctomyces sp.]|nr:hypothetical protein [Planctomyces sp.]
MIGFCWWVCSGSVGAQFDLERAPINYETTPVDDPATQLQSRLERKESLLTHTPEHGYLKSLLRELDIPVSSQILVFSKTSLQSARISPRTPRAIYFNDESYVGWIPRSDVMEVMSTDPEQGQVFHTLEQNEIDPPVLRRDQGNCLVC